jgi:DNA repair protein SbcC/Rad50
MKLEAIRLHPFGRFNDELRDLSQPLVVVHGPNEMGKSTLRQGIVHALFTPTKLTKPQFEKAMRPWLPLPAGDHAQVTLTFEHDGTTWTLEKRWGAGQTSRLSDGTTTLTDPKGVQERLDTLLEHGEATFRHVLFTGQAELERTLEAIEANAGELRDIRDLLRAGADAAADVDEERLRQVLEAKITRSMSRWDDARGAPERQNGQERGVGNEWKRDAGDILGAWYVWQRHVQEHRELLAIEQEIDQVNRQVVAIEEEIAAGATFVKEYGGLRASLHERGLLEERVPRLTQNLAALTKAFRGWPKAEAAIDEWTRQRPDLEQRQKNLQQERADADSRREAAKAAEAFTAIKQAKQACEEAEAEAAKHLHPGTERLAEVERLEKGITTAENKLTSRSLSWRIESDEPGSVRIERGSEPPQTVAVGPDGAAGTAEARLRLVAGGITLTVESGGDDVASLLTSLADDRASLADKLQACGAESPAAVRRMAERHRETAAAASLKQAVLAGLLRGKAFAAWAAEAAAVEHLPSTRAIPAIETELGELQKRLLEGDAAATQHADALAAWREAFTDIDALGERLLEAKSSLKHAEDQLAMLPSVPESFDSVKAFEEALENAQSQQLTGQKRLSAEKENYGGLTGRLADRRSEDVADEAEAAKRLFERARAQGRTYLRIREELDRLAANAGEDPLADFGRQVADIFSRITGGSATLGFEGQLPASVVRGDVSLPPDRLSHGGGGALALSVRLAMAEAYLDGGRGFVMLDDPFVHFDPLRMGVAADILRGFSARSQVIFFTCHDHHAERLRAGNSGVLSPPT